MPMWRRTRLSTTRDAIAMPVAQDIDFASERDGGANPERLLPGKTLPVDRQFLPPLQRSPAGIIASLRLLA